MAHHHSRGPSQVPGGTVKMRLLKRDPSPGLDEEEEDEEEEEHHIGAAATVDEK